MSGYCFKVVECFISTGAVAVPGNNFNGGNGPIWLNNVMCTGTESKLIRCPSSELGLANCGHDNDAGVICPSEIGNSKL